MKESACSIPAKLSRGRRAQRPEAVGAVDVQPQAALAADLRDPAQVVDHAEVGGAGRGDDREHAVVVALERGPERRAGQAAPRDVERAGVHDAQHRPHRGVHLLADRHARRLGAAVARPLARGVQGRQVAVGAALDEAAAGRVGEAGQRRQPRERLVLGVHGAGRLQPRAAVERVDADQQVDERGRRRRDAGDEGEIERVVDRGAGGQQHVAQHGHRTLGPEPLGRDRPPRQLIRLAREPELRGVCLEPGDRRLEDRAREVRIVVVHRHAATRRTFSS
jgi:hypothetical protein